MTRSKLQYRFLSGWRWWVIISIGFGLVMAVALTLALWRQTIVAVAKDCN